MAEMTLVKWGFVVGEFQKEELVRRIKRHKLQDSDAHTMGYAIERCLLHDLSSIEVGKQIGWHPIFIFGQVDCPNSSQMCVSSRITYISNERDYVTTINHSKYSLQGQSFLDIFRKTENYNPEHES